MRNRIVTVLVATIVGVVLLYGIPRAYFLADLVQDHEQAQTQRSADLMAFAVTEREELSGDVSEDFLEGLLHPHESLVLVTAGGTTVQAGPPVGAEDSTDDLVAVRSLPDGTELTLRRSGDIVRERVGAALLPLFLIGLALAAGASLVVLALAGRLARPFHELAAVADAIGRGHFDVAIPHYRVREAHAISEAMRRGIARLEELQRRERDIATNASHELRTPISALRMGIEDLASWPETPPQVAEELTGYLPELDRLSTAVRTYLDAAQQQRLLDVDVVDLVAVVRSALDRWRRRLRGSGGPVLLVVDEPSAPLLVCASDSAVSEILDHLLQDAVDRRPTHVLVEVDSTARYGRVRLELEGARTPDGHERGEKQAATVTTVAIGGRLTTVDGHTLVMLRRSGESEEDDGSVPS